MRMVVPGCPVRLPNRAEAGESVRRPGIAALCVDAWVGLLTIVLLWPQRLSGYGLGHDMVFTPRQPLTLDSFGLGTAAPRAVPLDALVALASRPLDGAIIGRIALVVPLLLAGWGARRLLAASSVPAQLLVSGFAVWNPYVIERLALGQWALLWAYGSLPWLIRAANRIRTGDRSLSTLAGLTCTIAGCSITPTGGLIGAVTAVVIASSRSVRRTGAVVVVAVLLQLPWVLPALTTGAGLSSDPRAVASFGARAERPGGPLLSLFGLGGIWNADVTPVSRAGALGYVTTVVTVALLVIGWPILRRRFDHALLDRLTGLAAGGLVLAAASTLPGLSALLRWAVREMPGAGLLRDGQKWLLPFVLLAVLAAGAAVERISALPWRAPVAVGAAVLPLLLLPDATGTLKVPLMPVHYPKEWRQVADRVRDGDVVVLPFASYRSFPWAPGRSVLDPAPRLLRTSVVVNDQLVVSGQILAGEDARAVRVGAALSAGPELSQRLAAVGVRWVVVETDTPGPPLPDVASLRPVVTGGAVELYEVGDAIDDVARSALRRAVVMVADVLAAGLALCGFGFLAAKRCYRLVQFRNTPTSEGNQWAS
jgi:hypothetical protein